MIPQIPTLVAPAQVAPANHAISGMQSDGSAKAFRTALEFAQKDASEASTKDAVQEPVSAAIDPPDPRLVPSGPADLNSGAPPQPGLNPQPISGAESGAIVQQTLAVSSAGLLAFQSADFAATTAARHLSQPSVPKPEIPSIPVAGVSGSDRIATLPLPVAVSLPDTGLLAADPSQTPRGIAVTNAAVTGAAVVQAAEAAFQPTRQPQHSDNAATPQLTAFASGTDTHRLDHAGGRSPQAFVQFQSPSGLVTPRASISDAAMPLAPGQASALAAISGNPRMAQPSQPLATLDSSDPLLTTDSQPSLSPSQNATAPASATPGIAASPFAIDSADSETEPASQPATTGGPAGFRPQPLTTAHVTRSAEASVLLRATDQASATADLTAITAPNLPNSLLLAASAAPAAALGTLVASPPPTEVSAGPQSSLGTTAPPPTALPPATAPALAQAIHQAGGNTVELVLTPNDLGRLRFEVTQTGEQLRIHLTVERPETLDLLRRNADQLMSEFRQAGFSGATLSFGQGGQSRQDQPPASPDAQATLASTPAEPSPAFAKPPPSGGLDLRL